MVQKLKCENFDKWQSINNLNCNDINISYTDKIKLYEYYDRALHVLCLVELSNKGFKSINDYYDLSRKEFLTKNTFLIIKGLFLKNKIKIGSKTFMRNIITFLNSEKIIRNIKLDNLLNDKDIDYTEEFIQWYPYWDNIEQLINII